MPFSVPALPGRIVQRDAKRPGESDGPCEGETDYGFSERQARELVDHAARATDDLATIASR